MNNQNLKIGSLFSGIGGLELGLESAGVGHTIWQVERDEHCRNILSKHWPNVERFEDVQAVGSSELAEVDIICGGFPCQDISSAGKREGLAGSRSGLWFEYARIVRELAPRWVVVENVASGAKRWVDQVTAELEQLGYGVLPVPLSANDVEAPHLRKRIFLIAHSDGKQLRKQQRGRCGESGQGTTLSRIDGKTWPTAIADDDCEPVESKHGKVANLRPLAGFSGWFGGPTISPVCGVDARVPRRVDRLRGLGNSVVPQCAEVIGWMIQELILNQNRE